jgi:hypothetical protein
MKVMAQEWNIKDNKSTLEVIMMSQKVIGQFIKCSPIEEILLKIHHLPEWIFQSWKRISQKFHIRHLEAGLKIFSQRDLKTSMKMA